MENQLVEFMTRLRLQQQPHVGGGFLFIAPPTARVAMIIDSGGIRRQFDLRGFGVSVQGACGHGGIGFGWWFMAPQVADVSAKDQDGGHQADQRDPGKEVVGGHGRIRVEW
jgi:hypothetical protein